MKKTIVTISFLISFLAINAQQRVVKHLTTFDEKKLHFGFTLGINTLDFSFDHYNTLDENPNFDFDLVLDDRKVEIDSVRRIVRADVQTLVPGFTVGIVSNLRLARNLDLRFLPGLSFGNRRVVYNVPIFDFEQGGIVEEYSVRSTYLDFPLLIKYKSNRLNNQRPYMFGGVAFRYDISRTGSEDLLRLRNPGLYVEAGMGWDTYLNFFRLSTELKFSFGITNVLDSPPKYPAPSYYNYALRRLTSNIVTLSFHFE